jgi:hypothetical protein
LKTAFLCGVCADDLQFYYWVPKKRKNSFIGYIELIDKLAEIHSLLNKLSKVRWYTIIPDQEDIYKNPLACYWVKLREICNNLRTKEIKNSNENVLSLSHWKEKIFSYRYKMDNELENFWLHLIHLWENPPSVICFRPTSLNRSDYQDRKLPMFSKWYAKIFPILNINHFYQFIYGIPLEGITFKNGIYYGGPEKCMTMFLGETENSKKVILIRGTQKVCIDLPMLRFTLKTFEGDIQQKIESCYFWSADNLKEPTTMKKWTIDTYCMKSNFYFYLNTLYTPDRKTLFNLNKQALQVEELEYIKGQIITKPSEGVSGTMRGALFIYQKCQ